MRPSRWWYVGIPVAALLLGGILVLLAQVFSVQHPAVAAARQRAAPLVLTPNPASPDGDPADGALPQGCLGGWNIVPSPNPGIGYNIGITAFAANDVWTVGFTNSNFSLIEHWDGTAWVISPNPSIGPLYGIGGIAPNDIWAMGNGTLHWDGTAWSRVPAPGGRTLQSVAGVASNDMWAVGYTSYYPYGQAVIDHWDGTSWSTVPFNSGGGFNFVTARAANDVWAVGTTGGGARSLIAHWDGTTWSSATTPAIGNDTMFGVTAFAPDNVWVVGESGIAPNFRTLIMHWDGLAWSIVPSPNIGIGAVINGISPVSPTDLWAAGYYIDAGNTTQTMTMHWNGTAWSLVPSPGIAGIPNSLNGIVSINATDSWVTGFSNGFSVPRTLDEQYTGFCNVPTPTPTATGVVPPGTFSPTPTATATPRGMGRLPANVCVSLAQDPDTAIAPGTIFTYTLRVRNSGPGVAYSTGVQMALDPNVEVLDFHSPDSRIYVDYLDDAAVSVRFQDLGVGLGTQAEIIARLRPTAGVGTILTSQVTAFWDDTRIHRTSHSNTVAIKIGPTEDAHRHGLRQTLGVSPAGPVDAGTRLTLSGEFFCQEEAVSFWLNQPDGTVVAIDNMGRSDMAGKVVATLDTTGFGPGSYSFVAHGWCSTVEGVGTFTIR